MKCKKLLIVILLLVSIVFTGCGNNKSDDGLNNKDTNKEDIIINGKETKTEDSVVCSKGDSDFKIQIIGNLKNNKVTGLVAKAIVYDKEVANFFCSEMKE